VNMSLCIPYDLAFFKATKPPSKKFSPFYAGKRPQQLVFPGSHPFVLNLTSGEK